VYISKQGKPPVITPGKLMPDLLFDFENGAYLYFSFKEVKPEKEVAKVASGLHKNWLEPGWVKLLILGSFQGTKPITDWIILIESTNALLLGHACMLSTNDHI